MTHASLLSVGLVVLGCGGSSKMQGGRAGAGGSALGGDTASAADGGELAEGGSSNAGASGSGPSGGAIFGGSSGSTSSGAGGQAGASTTGGSAGSTVGGSGSSAGGPSAGFSGSSSSQAGSSGGFSPPATCDDASECVVPETDPPGCAEARCELRRCRYVTKTDADGDGAPAPGCASKNPNIAVVPGTDCDDENPNVSPGRLELCNGLDDDCDGLTDLQYGTAETEPPAPFATLECFDGEWEISAWHMDAHTSPPSPEPFGPVTITHAVLFTGSDPAFEVPNTLFVVERHGTDAQGDQMTVDLDLQVLAEMPPADRNRVIAIFAASGTLSLEVDIEPWQGIGFAIPATGVPFHLP